MLNNVVKNIIETWAFRVCLFLLSIFLYKHTIYPLLWNTSVGTLDVVWGILIIPLLFMFVFKGIRGIYYLLAGILLVAISVIMLSYGSQSNMILLLYAILLILYILIAKNRFSHPFSRILFVLTNILIAGSVYVFQLGYNPISLKDCKIVDDYRLKRPWNMVLVEKDSLLGIVDANSGEEIVPIFFTDVTRQEGIENPYLVLRRKLTKEQKDIIFKNKVGSTSTGWLFNPDSQDVRIRLDFFVEDIYRENLKGKLHSYQQGYINVSDSFYRKTEEDIIKTLGKFHYKFQNDLLHRALYAQSKSDSLISDLTNSLVGIYEGMLSYIDNNIKADTLSYEDITELRMLLVRSLTISDLIKMSASNNWQQMCLYLDCIFNNSIPNPSVVNGANNLNSNIEFSFNKLISYEVLDLIKRKADGIRKAFLQTCFNDYKIHEGTIESLFRNRDERFKTFLENEERDLIALRNGINQNSSSVDSLLSYFVKAIDRKAQTKQRMKNSWEKMSVDSFYNHPKNKLDTLIFIKVPQTLNAVLNNESAIDLHSSVEEISAYLYFASFMRGYNVYNYLNGLKKQMEKKNSLMHFVNNVDSIQSSQHDIILKLLEEL